MITYVPVGSVDSIKYNYEKKVALVSVKGLPEPLAGVAPTGSFLLDAGYWLLPKPLDMSGIFFDAMDAGAYSTPVPELAAAKTKGAFHPELSVLASLAFAVGVLAVAAYEFRGMDY